MNTSGLTLPTAVSTAPVSVPGGTGLAGRQDGHLIIADNLTHLLDQAERNAARSNIPEYGRIYFAHLADQYREALRVELGSM